MAETQPDCPQQGTGIHDGGGTLGPLYIIDIPTELPVNVACNACCQYYGIPDEGRHEMPWPPN